MAGRDGAYAAHVHVSPTRTAAEIELAVGRTMASLSLDDKCGLLSGDQTLLDAAQMARHYNRTPILAGVRPDKGIDGIRFSDGPRGVVMHQSTAFPCSMARGATFDPELERLIGDAIGVECRAQGANLFAGICVNVLRHPAWGRAQETYGEEPFHLGELGVALMEGAQRHVMGCVKHFACNSMENARFKVDVRADPADLVDLYLPHFERIVRAGVASVMSAYNKVNGEWAGHSTDLLTDVLKRRWGFEGFVMTDFVLGMRNAVDAFNGGQDLEMPFRWRSRGLASSVRSGDIDEERIDDAVRRLLRMQGRFAEIGEPTRYGAGAVGHADHRALARRAADESIVLLRNEDVGGRPALPFDETVRSVAVIGRLADLENTGDRGSSWVRDPEVVTTLAGIRSLADRRGVSVTYDDGSDPERAARVAAAADAAVVVAGYTHRDEGEFLFLYGGDRDDLTLGPRSEALILAVAASQRRTVVAMVGGSAIVTEAWRNDVAAVLMAWYGGSAGGDALAGVLWGEVDPSGRLPCTFPRGAAQLPPFDKKSRSIHYGPLFGYRLFIATHRHPAFWFGFGLGYTSMSLGSPTVTEAEDGSAHIDVPVSNDGGRAGVEVVQVYVDLALGTHREPLPTLRSFARVTVEPGATAQVRLVIDAATVARARDGANGTDGELRVGIGPSADPTSHIRATLPAASA